MKRGNFLNSVLALVLVMLIVISMLPITAAADGATVFSVSEQAMDTAIEDTAAYLYKTVKSPQVGSVGGEWAVIGLARSGYAVPDQYFQNYYRTVEKYVRDCKGVLHEKKYTEYSRLAVALTAIGKDPRDVAGYNLLMPLGDYEKTIWQGINGSIWALIALDSGNYDMPQNPDAKVQATRDMYINRILACQLSDGGFSLFGGMEQASGDEKADPDITGMALQALAKYQKRDDVKKVIDEALECLSKLQNEKGGFESWGTPNSESSVQVIVALTELGIVLDDARFIKKGHTLLNNLMTFYLPGKGFKHTADGSRSNQMATEQAFYGLVAAQRAFDGKNSLYRMGDALNISDEESKKLEKRKGLEDKNDDVKAVSVIYPEKTFSDISGHENQQAIETLAARGIINGKTDASFDPEDTMTRAEFAAIVVRSLGLSENESSNFTDVNPDNWYSGYVGAAYEYGIIKGKSEAVFNPMETISREEAAVMIMRAAKLAGIDTDFDNGQVRDILAQFTDYVTASDWAYYSLAFCYREDILSQQDLEIKPKIAIKRCEIAEMLYRMLGSANLI